MWVNQSVSQLRSKLLSHYPTLSLSLSLSYVITPFFRTSLALSPLSLSLSSSAPLAPPLENICQTWYRDYVEAKNNMSNTEYQREV